MAVCFLFHCGGGYDRRVAMFIVVCGGKEALQSLYYCLTDAIGEVGC